MTGQVDRGPEAARQVEAERWHSQALHVLRCSVCDWPVVYLTQSQKPDLRGARLTCARCQLQPSPAEVLVAAIASRMHFAGEINDPVAAAWAVRVLEHAGRDATGDLGSLIADTVRASTAGGGV